MDEEKPIDEKEELRKRLLKPSPKTRTTFFKSYVLPYIIIVAALMLVIGFLTTTGAISTKDKVNASVAAETNKETQQKSIAEKKLNNTEPTKSS